MQLRQKFQTVYDAAMGPRRKAAATRFAADIERGDAHDAPGEPAAPGTACAGRGRSASGLDAMFNYKPDPAAEAAQMDALRAKPALSAAEAEALVILTCRTLHDRAVAAQVAGVVTNSGVGRTLADGERLAVPRHEDGRLLEVDALALVRGAAADGIRVEFEPGGMWSNPSMSITPSGAKSPRLDGALHEETDQDGTKLLVIRKLDPLPGLRTPEETITCLLTPVDQADGEARLNMFGAIGGAMFSNIPELHGGDVRNAMARAEAVKACRAAKAEFMARSRSAVR